MIFRSGYPANIPKRHTIFGAYLMDENQCVDELLASFQLSRYFEQQIQQHATKLVQVVRENSQSFGGLNAFVQEYELLPKEGAVLLCLVEALLYWEKLHKTGEPHYLYRFCTERVLTTNCAANGVTASLLSLK